MNSCRSPLVTVIVPTYNRADTIRRAIRSVLAQTFQDFEIVVVDDGSTDDTQAAVAEFDDSRVRYVRRASNGGEAAARNTGVSEARGEYIAWLDSDDEWFNDKLREQMDLLAERGDVDAACTGYVLHHEEFQWENTVIERLPSDREHLMRHLLMGCALGLGTTFVGHRRALDHVGQFDETLIRHTDWDWLVRFVRGHGLAMIERPLARVHFSTARVSARDVEAAARTFVSKHHEDLRQLGRYWGRKALARRWLEVARYFYADREFGKGTAYLLRALTQNPVQRPGLYAALADAALGTRVVSAVTRRRAAKRLH